MDTNNETELQVIQPSALEHLTRGEIDIQIATARKYPRSAKDAMNRMIELATVTRATAQAAYYRLPRQEWDPEARRMVDKVIEGPSVRLAEVAASSWGNLRFGARVVEIGRDRVVAQGFCADLETNNAYSGEVSASILTKRGKRYPEHMVTTTANAACSKALRNAVFRIIPRAYVDQVLKECKQVAIGRGMTMIQRWREIAASFSRHGADEKAVLAAVGRKGVADVTTDDLVHLHGLLTAIEDGDVTTDKALRPTAGDSGPEPSTIADDLTPDEQKGIDAKRDAQAELDSLIKELSDAGHGEAVENVTRSAPDVPAALTELKKLKAKADMAAKKESKP